MTIRSFATSLRGHPQKYVRFVLPDETPVPAEFHVTEVGHVVKRFIDCGGTIRSRESCLLQAWVAEDDPSHRLSAGKLAGILEQARTIVPSDDLEVEVEYGGRSVSQYIVESGEVAGEEIRFLLGNKQTDCLAREQCGLSDAGCGCAGNPGKCC